LTPEGPIDRQVPAGGADPGTYVPANPGRTRRPVLARVTDFDADAGLGALVTDDGRALPFHCTAIADGTRRIDVGRRVVCLVVAGHLGRMEAADLVTIDEGV
jgi:cold shock protein